MKLIKCDSCKAFHSINKPSLSTCFCCKTYFRLSSQDLKRVFVHGDCSVWYVSDKDLLKFNQGTIVRMQCIKEPNPNVRRVSKGRILFMDRFDKELIRNAGKGGK